MAFLFISTQQDLNVEVVLLHLHSESGSDSWITGCVLTHVLNWGLLICRSTLWSCQKYLNY